MIFYTLEEIAKYAETVTRNEPLPSKEKHRLRPIDVILTVVVIAMFCYGDWLIVAKAFQLIGKAK